MLEHSLITNSGEVKSTDSPGAVRPAANVGPAMNPSTNWLSYVPVRTMTVDGADHPWYSTARRESAMRLPTDW